MTTLVVGASGATGRLLVRHLLDRGHKVRAIVRSSDSLPADIADHNNLSVIVASILELSDEQLKQHTAGCQAVASCLGHSLTLKGVFGKPRRLVTEATRRLTLAIKANQADEPTKFLLMNTSGNRNHDLKETVSFAERCVVGLIRLLVPPHADNEQAAEHLRTEIGQHDSNTEWVAVRPDSLTNEDQVTSYETFASPVRSAIFNAGKVSRINVAHFMAELITENDVWEKWKGQMPVIYNKEQAT